jgi:hypothetical protein
MADTNQSSTLKPCKEGSSHDVNETHSAPGGKVPDKELNPGKGSGHDVGTGSLTDKGLPYKLRK